MDASRREKDPPEPSGSQGRRLFGRFRVERTLGQGGMGEVLLAHDELLRRRVALKRLSYGDDRTQRRRAVLNEARRASQVNDRRIAAIYDVLDLDDELLLVMEYVDGPTLRQVMAEPVPLEAFWSIATQCVEAIGAAHAHGVIHRDIKPENVIVTGDGEVKVLDFGIAKRTEGAPAGTTTLTGPTAQVAGTPAYMAPEAHLGGTVDERSDLFSLGVVFYELLARKHPFAGATYAAVVGQILGRDPPPVHELQPAVGPALSRIIARMLAKQPVERYATAAEVLRDLVEARAGGEPAREIATAGAGSRAAQAPGAPAERPLEARRQAAWLGRALALVAVAIVAATVVWWRGSLARALPRERNLAVLAPGVAGANPEWASFALGFTELLSARLQRHTDTPGFQMASFREGYDEGARSAPDARKVLGANLALLVTLEQRPDVFQARLDLVDAVRERTIVSRTVETPTSEPFAFLNRACGDATAMLGLADRDGDAAPQWGIHGAGTLRFYLQGIGLMRAAKAEADARRAVADLEVACRTEPEAAPARAGLAAAQLKTHLLNDDPTWLASAEASAREAVALDSLRAEGHRILGMVLAAKKETEAALPELARAVELNPADDDVCSQLGRTYGRLGQREREKQTYLTAIERRPHCWQPYWWLATWHFRAGDIDASIRAYEAMIRRSPHLHKGYSSLGGVLVLHGEYARAIETLKQAVALRPTKVAFDNLGTAYFNSGRFSEAIAAYNQSFQFGFADYESWLNLGDAYFWLRDRKDQAAEAYGQAIRLGREEVLARAQEGRSADVMIPANLSTVFPKLGRPDSARAYLDRAIAADSTNSMVAYCAALTHWQLQERDRAIAWLEKSVQGGYPVVWLRDSPIFREWRGLPEFRALVGDSGATPRRTASRSGAS